MGRRAFAMAFCLALAAACAPPTTRPPGPGPGPAATDEISRERARLQEQATARQRERVERIERVGRRLLSKMSDPPRVQFILVGGDPSINAGATFGQVGVTDGMMNFIRSDDELAAVLGHEVAHITEGHVTKGLIGGIALTALAILVESQAPGLGRTAGSVGQLFLNRFTQSQERGADRVGMVYAYQAGYDPRAAATIQERLAIEAPETMAAGFFSTHPSSVERKLAAEKQAAGLLAKGPPPGRDEVLAMARAEARTAEVAQETRLRYREEDPPASPSATGECARAAAYMEMGNDAADPEEAERFHLRALRVCPELPAAHVGLGRALRAQGKEVAARREFERALELDPDDVEAQRELRR